MFIGKKNSTTQGYDQYLEELKEKTITISKYLSIIGLPTIIYFMYQDLYIVKIKELLFGRLIFLVVFIAYFCNTFFIRNHSRRVITFLHNSLLISLLFMSVVMILNTISAAPFTSVHSRGSLGALIVNTFVVFSFSGISSRWLHWIIFLPNVFLVIIFASHPVITAQESLAFLGNYVFIALLLIVRSFHQEYVHFDEFLYRYQYKEALEKNMLLNNKLKKQATYDMMTETYNRNAGLELLELNIAQVLRNKFPLSIAFVDADGLKKVNDEYGHEMGDKYLNIIVDNLRAHLRSADYIIRVGGDEFVVVYYDCSLSNAEEIIANAHKTLKASNCPFNCDFSYGVATFNKEYMIDSMTLLNEADKKMYEQKKRKKSCVV